MRKILSIMLVLVMLVMIVACDSTGKNLPNNDNETNSTDGSNNEGITNSDNETTSGEGGNQETQKTSCDSHNYVENICSVCKCSRWSGNVDTSWYSVLALEFTITTADQFAGFIQIVNGGTDFSNVKVKLANHIDMNGEAISPIGASESTVFAGDFNGDNYYIENVLINTNSIVKTGIEIFNDEMYYSSCAGLFGYCEGNLSNVNLKNLNINIATNDINNLDVGGLVVYGDASVTNCSVDGKITVQTNKQFTIGGLVAISTAEVSHCYSSMMIDAKLNCDDDVNPNIGGLIAYKRGNTVKESYSKGSITFELVGDPVEVNTLYIGGLIGYTYEADVMNSYSVANVSATATRNNLCNVGGLIGRMEKGVVDSCYATGDVSLDCKEEGFAGGLIGYVRTGYFSSVLSTIKVKNCFALGTVYCNTNDDYNTGSASTIGVDAEEVLENCFYLNSMSLTGDEIVKNGTPATMNDFQNIAFYESRMPWDSSIWILVDGALPLLK